MVTEQLHEATAELITALSAANLYFADQAPWGKKDDLARMGAILATTADVVRRCAIAAQPFVPDRGREIPRFARCTCGSALLQHALDPGPGRRGRNAAAAAGAGVQEVRAGQGRLNVLIDSHCHLDFPDWRPIGRRCWRAPRRQASTRMVTISTRVERFDEITAIAERNPNVWCSVGTHPHHAA